MDTAFQGNAFQNDAFQIATAVNRLTIEYCFDLEMGYPLFDDKPTGQYRKPEYRKRAPFVTVEGLALIEATKQPEDILRYSSMEEQRSLKPLVAGSTPATASKFTLADHLKVTGTQAAIDNLSSSLRELKRHDNIIEIKLPYAEPNLTQEEEELVLLMMLAYDEQLC